MYINGIEHNISLIFIHSLNYPTPSHFEEMAQFSCFDDLCRVAEIDVITTNIRTKVKNLVEHSPIFRVVASQFVIDSHHPSFFI